MKQIIKDYFTYNKRERKGILILVTIVIVLILSLNLSPVFYKKQATDFSEFEKKIAEFQAGIVAQNPIPEIKSGKNKKFISNISPDSALRFEFNPNNLSEADWKRLGLPDKQIRIIKNYEANGGKFKKKEDLMKIFGFTQKLYESLENYIVIPEKSPGFRVGEAKKTESKIIYKVQIASSSKRIERKPENFNSLQDVSEYQEDNTFKYFIGNENRFSSAEGFRDLAKSKGYAQAFIVAFNNGKKISFAEAKKLENGTDSKYNNERFFSEKQNQKVIIEINSADTLEWEKLRGIGPSYARRIVKYRESLGGFLAIEQLKEVWGMNDTLYNLIFPHLIIDVSKMKKININACIAENLQRHPYIKNWNVANAVVNYRTKHGVFKTVEEIKKTDLVNDSLYRKIAPYLTVE